MTELPKKLRHYEVVILFDADDFKRAHDVGLHMLEKTPFVARILKLEEVTLNKDG